MSRHVSHEDDAHMRKLRSRITTDGLDRAPHRAFMRAMGLDDEAIAKPMVGVVSMKGEQTPCNMTHDFHVAAAKIGIEDWIAIPVSGLNGDNVMGPTERTSWYAGPTLLEHLDTVPIPHARPETVLPKIAPQVKVMTR